LDLLRKRPHLIGLLQERNGDNNGIVLVDHFLEVLHDLREQREILEIARSVAPGCRLSARLRGG
jgi:hypothetical protein